uniref:Calcium-binding protein n=1 Tax=Desertifilum tharense IPPAS B-1220 TaxID=1781255 RepID=A0ACD5GND2_9CYAN
MIISGMETLSSNLNESSYLSKSPDVNSVVDSESQQTFRQLGTLETQNASFGIDNVYLLSIDADTFSGSPDNDWIIGLSGDDVIWGLQGNDRLLGNQGNDTLHGNEGDDTIHGGKGDDSIRGGKGNDLLLGDLGDDTLWGDRGSNTLQGGEGSDVFVLTKGFGSSTLNEADFILDFGRDRNFIGLVNGLTYEALNIFQGTQDYSSDTIIQERETGEYLAVIKGILSQTLTATDFITLDSPSSPPEIIPDGAGNTLDLARDIGYLTEEKTFSDFVGDLDLDDYYQFSLESEGEFRATLEGLSANADLHLLDGTG